MAQLTRDSSQARRLRDWLPFGVAALGILAVAVFTPACRCAAGMQHMRIIRMLLVFPLGLLAIRHAWAFGRKERGFPWVAYLLMTIAIPFFAAFLEYLAGDAHGF